MSEKKRSSPVGCLIVLLLIVPPFFFVPTGVAVGFAILCVVYLLAISEIIQEFKRISKRKVTNKSTIAAARAGFVELVAKLVDQTHDGWLVDERLDYHELIFFKVVYSQSSEDKTRKLPFHEYRSSPRVWKITDGSGECWVSLHNAQFHLKSKYKKLKKPQLLELLKDKPLPDFPMDKLEDRETFWVEEKYIPAGTPVNFYGHLSKAINSAPSELVSIQQNTKHDHRMEQQYRMTEEDWKDITNSTDQHEIKLLSSDYSPETFIESLIISLKGDNSLKWKSYLSIFMGILMLVVLLAFYGLYLWKGQPEFWEQMMSWLNV